MRLLTCAVNRGFREPQDISRIEWIGGNQGFFAIDNITFGGPPVPEPGTAACLASLAAGALLKRNRRRAPA